jgi:hypothetical protein
LEVRSEGMCEEKDGRNDNGRDEEAVEDDGDDDDADVMMVVEVVVVVVVGMMGWVVHGSSIQQGKSAVAEFRLLCL